MISMTRTTIRRLTTPCTAQLDQIRSDQATRLHYTTAYTNKNHKKERPASSPTAAEPITPCRSTVLAHPRAGRRWWYSTPPARHGRPPRNSRAIVQHAITVVQQGKPERSRSAVAGLGGPDEAVGLVHHHEVTVALHYELRAVCAAGRGG